MNIKDDKISTLKKIKATLEEMLMGARKAASVAQTEANYHVGAMQSRYDTFKEEAQYLAEAQKIRIMNLSDSISACDLHISAIMNDSKNLNIVEVGAYVRIQSDERKVDRHFFIVPYCSGERAVIGGRECLCITPDAPAICPFVGLNVGDYPDVSDSDPRAEYYIAEIW